MSLDLTSLIGPGLPQFSEADWRESVAKVLKGASFDKLRTPTPDGITIEPLYARAGSAAVIATAHGAAPWVVSQRIDHPNIKEANGLALADLDGGASGLDLVFASSPHARGFGIASDADPSALLDGVLADLIAIRIDAGAQTIAKAQGIVAWAAAKGIAADKLAMTLSLDPIGMAARAGGSQVPLSQEISDTAAAVAALAETLPKGGLLAADGRFWHEAGASRVETLAAVLATAVAYWRALERAGLATEVAAERIGFTLAIDQGQFSGMAEIRALRLLWARATAAAGMPAVTPAIHAETSFRMMSRLDANTNLIRTTIAAFAAAVGGADRLTVLPFSAATGLPDAFARRLARNSQLILQEESNLYRVVDPAAGAGRVEDETRALAEAAWALFREIEAAGGIAASLANGALQARIAATAAAGAKNIARRKEPLTGVSEYPILTMPATAVLDVAPRAAIAAEIAHPLPKIGNQRLSEPFERLRATAVTADLKVFMANLGTVADFNVRSAWASNLFEVGGIAALGNDGFASLDALVAAFKASGTSAVCLASSDAVYAAVAVPAAAALKAAGAGPIFFAGKPGEGFQEDSLRASGVNVFLQAGQDVIAVLADAQARLQAH